MLHVADPFPAHAVPLLLLFADTCCCKLHELGLIATQLSAVHSQVPEASWQQQPPPQQQQVRPVGLHLPRAWLGLKPGLASKPLHCVVNIAPVVLENLQAHSAKCLDGERRAATGTPTASCSAPVTPTPQQPSYLQTQLTICPRLRPCPCPRPAQCLQVACETPVRAGAGGWEQQCGEHGQQVRVGGGWELGTVSLGQCMLLLLVAPQML